MLIIQQERLPMGLVPLSAREAALLILNVLVLLPCKPAELHKPHHILLWEPGNTSPSFYYKTCLPQTLLIHSIPECNPCVALHDVWCPPWLSCECIWLIHYWCQVLSLSRYVGPGNPPSNKWIGDDQNRTAYRNINSHLGNPERRIPAQVHCVVLWDVLV